jgi:hypothetical protein
MNTKRAREIAININELGLTISLMWHTKDRKKFPLSHNDLLEMIFLINKTALTVGHSLKDKQNDN